MELPRAPRRTTPAFAFKHAERSLQDGLRQRKFGRDEMLEVAEFFRQWEPQPSCAYCGGDEVKRWDHVVPVMSGGAMVLGNMVLSCSVCDDSKRRVPLDEWMRSDVPKAPKSRGVPNFEERLDRIEAYVQHFGYQPKAVEDSLTAEELERLKDAGQRIASLRRDVESLVADYQERVGP